MANNLLIQYSNFELNIELFVFKSITRRSYFLYGLKIK